MLKKLSVLLVALMTIFATAKCSSSDIKKNNKDTATEIVFILDRSGSMQGLELDTIGGFNAMLAKQKKENPHNAFITTVLFNGKYEFLHNRLALSETLPLTDKEYVVSGSTALLDAIGHTILKVKQSWKKSDKVLFIIVTDGMENSSREFKLATIKEMVETHRELGWEFLFIGANIDAIQVASSVGIDPTKAVKYKADSRGTQKNYQAIDNAITHLREGKEIDSSWKKEIEEDMKQREK